MDIRRLEQFLAVVDFGGFTAAAAEVDVSQPALSLGVRDLERELGTALFDRVGRRVLLTAAGEALVGPARQAIRDVAIGRAAVAAVAGLEAGRLVVASLPTLAVDPAADLVGRFRMGHPGISVSLVAAETADELAGLVRDGSCEVGVTEAADAPAGLAARPLGRQALRLVLPPGTPVAGSRLPLATLAATPFVAAPAGTSTRRLLDEGFARAGASPTVAVVTAQRDAIVPLVVAGAGAALVPPSQAREAAAQGAVVVDPVPAVVRSLALAHRPGALAPAAAAFIAEARPLPVRPESTDP
jgi:LysR family transcriptional regulator, carnitine catabolism transcriptional activator